MMVLTPISGRARKILDRFPSFMRLEKPGKALGDVAVALGRDLDHAEGRLGRILAARRIGQAQEAGDILRLGALLGLVEEDFFLLRQAYAHGLFAPAESNPPLAEEEAAWTEYDDFSDALRDAVVRTAQVLIDGCGTLWALAEGGCLLLGARNSGPETLEHIDSFSFTGGFIHRLKARFRTQSDAGWSITEHFLFVQENPIVDKESEKSEARQRQLFPVHRGGFFHGRCDIAITGSSNRCVKPLVINQTTREGYGYRGVIEDGKELVFARDGQCYLDGENVTEQCFRIRDGFFNDSEMARFEDGGEPVHGFAITEPVGAFDRNQPGPGVTGLEELPVPRLLHGDNTFRFSVEEGAFDASRFDEAVFAFPKDPEAIAALPASGKLQIRWREHQAFCVKILLPPELKTYESVFLSGGSLPQHLARGLERFRPAGVRLEVDYWNEEWVLGQSVLEDAGEPSGEGVDFNAPVL